MVGHKSGDPACPALPEEGSILTFSGYQHVLSNHYTALISAFGMDTTFRSVEHAFLFKMATDLGYHELAGMELRLQSTLALLSKDLAEDDRRQWEDNNMDLVKELIAAKSPYL